jgi:hypothetical protein
MKNEWNSANKNSLYTMIFWVMMPSGLAVFPDDGGSKTLVTTHQAILSHMTEEHIMNVHHHGNFSRSKPLFPD